MSAPALAIFGFGGGVLGLFLTLAILGLIAVWIALIVFTYNDARKRISDSFLVGASTAASFFPFVGTLVYTILRPAEFLEDVKEREWDVRATQSQLRKLRASSCRKCGYPAESDFLRCPSCRSRLREPCPSCDRPVGIGWKVCPYCEETLVEPKRKADSRRSRRPSGRTGRSGEAGGSRAEAARARASKDPADSPPKRKTAAPKQASRSGGEEKPINAGDTPEGGGPDGPAD